MLDGVSTVTLIDATGTELTRGDGRVYRVSARIDCSADTVTIRNESTRQLVMKKWSLSAQPSGLVSCCDELKLMETFD